MFAQPQAGRAIAGIYVDQRSNLLFASGTQSGRAFVFDAGSGAELASYQLTTASAKFVNDVIVTRDAAYFTNSFAAEIYRVPLGPEKAAGSVCRADHPPHRRLGAESWCFRLQRQRHRGYFRRPLAVDHQFDPRELYRVNPQTGSATLVDLGGASLTAGDGLRLRAGPCTSFAIG